MIKLKQCPFCGNAWVYESVGDYTSAYENYGYKVNCLCGFAWEKTKYCKSKLETIKHWNDITIKLLNNIEPDRRDTTGKEFEEVNEGF